MEKKRMAAVLVGICLTLVLVMLPFMVACAAPKKEMPPAKETEVVPAPPKPVTLRFTCGLPVTHHATDTMKLFKQRVEERTDGRVKVSLFPGGELYKHKDVPRVIPAGAVEMAICFLGHLGGLNPIGNVSGYYFLIKTKDQWLEAKDTVWPIIDRLYNKSNIKVLVPFYYGTTALGSNRPLRVPADAKGMKIRGPTTAQLDCIKAWGGIGASLAAGEVYDALAKRAIDGVATGWTSHAQRAHYEIVKYFAGPCSFSIWAVVMNLDTWNSFTKDTQEVIMEVAKEASQYSLNVVETKDAEAIKTIRESGAKVHLFTPEELEEWTKATKPAFDKWVEDCSKAGCGEEAMQILKALGIAGY